MEIDGRGREKIFENGDIYFGNFEGNLPHGRGKYMWSDGTVYEGDWEEGKMTGKGKIFWPSQATYEGDFSGNYLHGSGTFISSDGFKYKGSFKMNSQHGTGRKEYPNSDVYDGRWRDGIREGSGRYEWRNGDMYIGNWKMGQMSGRGIMKWLNGDLFDGFWSNGLRHGSGCYRFGDGGYYFGTWTKGMKDGPGTFYLDNRTMAYDREYMQGVLIKERVRNISKLPHKAKERLKFAKEVEKSPCCNIFEGERSHYLMLSLQLGIRYTLGKITPVPLREVRSSDFGEQARIKMYFPRKGSRLTPPNNSVDFYWKDYCPTVFRNLRELFRLNAADYMVSICGVDGLRELSSPGKSGSLFYLSHDDRFVIKTLKKSELKVLLKMLPDYYSHVKAYDNTLITKFFGAHRITLRCRRKVQFVVMGNMFCSELRVHRRYDLKGSTQGRFTNKIEMDDSTTLKDLDLTYEFHMDKLLRESLLRQLALDSAFLESQDIIDYSVLLGLHFRAPEHLKSLLEQPPDSQHNAETTGTALHGVNSGEFLIPPRNLLLVTHEPDSVNPIPGPHIRGSALKVYSIGNKEADLYLPGTGRLRLQLGVNMPAQANQKLVQVKTADSSEVELFEVYDVVLYLGIIDILQGYNITKKIEHACKSMKFDPMTISAVEPKVYSRRFIDFLEKIFPLQP